MSNSYLANKGTGWDRERERSSPYHKRQSREHREGSHYKEYDSHSSPRHSSGYEYRSTSPTLSSESNRGQPLNMKNVLLAKWNKDIPAAPSSPGSLRNEETEREVITAFEESIILEEKAIEKDLEYKECRYKLSTAQRAYFLADVRLAELKKQILELRDMF